MATAYPAPVFNLSIAVFKKITTLSGQTEKVVFHKQS